MSHRTERPWGWFESLADPAGAKVKLLHVRPGHRISLQRHGQRSEYWVLLRGCAVVSVGDQTLELGPGDHCHIARGQTHRLTNIGADALELIEVQLGESLSEEDIERFEDDYGRN